MRLAKNIRNLTGIEKVIAHGVFWNTIPWLFIKITDGLGFSNREFTLNGLILTEAGIAV